MINVIVSPVGSFIASAAPLCRFRGKLKEIRGAEKRTEGVIRCFESTYSVLLRLSWRDDSSEAGVREPLSLL